MSYAPIACGRYDDYELACTRNDALRLHLDDGGKLVGTARTLHTVRGEGEYLELESANGDVHRVRLDRIVRFDTLPRTAPDGAIGPA